MDDADWLPLVVEGYEAAARGTVPQDFGRRLAHLFGAESAALTLSDDQGPARLLAATPNFEACQRDPDWASHWMAHDAWTDRAMSLGDPPWIALGQELMDPAELEKSGFYRDWLRHLDIFHVAGAVIDLDSAPGGLVAVHRPKDARPFDIRDRSRMAALLPHLRQMARLRRAQGPLDLGARASVQALRDQDIALFVTDHSGCLMHANEGALRHLAREQVLGLRGGRLVAVCPQDQLCLDALLQAWSGLHGGSSMPTRRLSVGRIEDGLAFELMLAPLHQEGPEPCLVWTLRECCPQGHALAMRESWRLRFGLTPRELDIAAALADGLTAQQAAQGLDLSPGHVRQRIKVLFDKTGQRSQAQLVALLLRGGARGAFSSVGGRDKEPPLPEVKT